MKNSNVKVSNQCVTGVTMKNLTIFLLILVLLIQATIFYTIARGNELWKPRPKIVSVKSINPKFIQGLATDGERWYFSYIDSLYAVKLSNIEEIVAANKRAIPEHLKVEGYNQIGDIDVYQDKIFAPIEDKVHEKTLIAVYLASTLEYINSIGPLPQKHIPWCTVDPSSQTILTSEFDEVDEIFVYNFEGKLVKKIKLSMKLHRIRGGKILGKHLYLTADDGGDTIYKIDTNTGEVEAYFKIGTPFKIGGIGYLDGHLYVTVTVERDLGSMLFIIDLFSESVNAATISYILILAMACTIVAIYLMLKSKN